MRRAARHVREASFTVEREPGEAVLATFAAAPTGGAWSMLQLAAGALSVVPHYVVAVSDRRVFVFRQSRYSSNATSVFERSTIMVAGWEPGKRSSLLMLSTPDGPLRLRVDRFSRDGAQAVVDLLTQPPPA
jgi:hypothetical protein